MQHRPNQNIELGSRPSSNSESSPISNPQNFAHLPEEDDRHDQDPQRPPQGYYSLYSKICLNKPINIAILLVLCFSIINLILLLHMGSSFFSRSDLQLQIKRSQPSQIWFLSDNLKADPIMEITIIDEKTTCPSGFQPLKLGNWTGTAAGCLCENGELFNSTCKKVASEKCKTDIPRTLPIEMYEWEHSIFCVKRAVLGTDYLKKAECPAGYTECYPGGCFKGDCPITKLEISSTGTPANKFTSAEKYLIATKIPGELPLINIQITLGDIPCFARDLFAESIKNSSYPLSNFQANACNKYGLDSHFSVRLDSQSAFDSFTENFFPYMTMHLPSFEENANSTISILSSTVRMKTAKQDYCQAIDEKPSQDYFTIVFGKAAVIFDPVIAFLGVFLQLLITMKILTGTAPKLDPELFEDVSELKSDLICLNVMSYIMLIPRVIWTYHVGQAFGRMKESFEEYLTLGCFEGGQGSEVISDYLKVLEGLEGNYWVSFMFWFTNVSIILVYVCYEIKKRRSIIKIHTD